jgi:hypothetical protein
MVDLNILRNAATLICMECDPDAFHEPINWGDLRCVSVEYCVNDSGDAHYLVLIEEAAPECVEFRSFVEQRLYECGYTDISLRTEW